MLRQERGPVLPHGLGRSYGDSALNAGGALLDARGLDRWIALDEAAGVLEAEAGMTLDAILRRLHASATREGAWFLPVTPGTRHVTLGGAVANDVHGKNHREAGTFGRHLLSLDLLRSDGRVRRCSPASEPELFAATVGGLGLTGLILSVRLRLARVSSLWLEEESLRTGSLDEFHRLSEDSGDWDHTVAWVDALAGGRALGRGVFSRARHAPPGRLPPPPPAPPRLSLPLGLPGGLLNRRTVGAFNALHWRRAPPSPRRRVLPYDAVLHPLDSIGRWNRLYGRRGFHQYQCVLPRETAREGVPALLRLVSEAGEASLLAVLKTLGDKPSPGLLSFPMPGTTLALDLPNRGARTLALLDRLDAVTAEAGGRVYPAKDGRVSARDFQRGYPAWRRLAAQADPAFSSSFWRRVSAAPGDDVTTA